MPRYPVVMEVVQIKEDLPPPCPVHEVGDRITVDNGCVEGKICLPVLAQHMARIYAVTNGLPGTDAYTIACPDKGKVVFSLRRDSTRWWKTPLSPQTEAELRPSSLL